LKLLDRALYLTIGVGLAAMVADVAIQIFFRYVIQNPPTWTEELARYLFVWDVFLAAGLAFGRGSHIVVDALLTLLPEGGRRVLSIFTNALVLAFLVVLVWQGIAMVRLTSNTVSTALNLNMGVVYASLPIGAAISALYVLVRLIDELRGVSPPVDPLQVMVD
jgi:TRAP-type C4-dicarboxylate transport system permease small subunit